MKTRTRFIKSVIETAAKRDVDLPWTRGGQRRARVAARHAKPTTVKSRSA